MAFQNLLVQAKGIFVCVRGGGWMGLVSATPSLPTALECPPTLEDIFSGGHCGKRKFYSLGGEVHSCRTQAATLLSGSFCLKYWFNYFKIKVKYVTITEL